MSEWINKNEAHHFIDKVFMQTARIVTGDCYTWVNNDYVRTYPGRSWFKALYRAFALHPAVYDMMLTYRPDDWHQLLLEWPHKAETDPNRLAYTRDERSGEANRQVVTSIGKYLTRHFRDAPDNLIRDIVAQHTYGGKIGLTHDMKRMVSAVMDGPSSCMTKNFALLCSDNVERHPYEVYDPSLGWGMAVRYEGDEVMGRCLVWTDPDNEDNRGFVRSYKREKGYSSHSGRDESIDAYLKGLGFKSWSSWPDGTPIMQYDLRREGYLMPYIDGSTQSVEEDGFVIDCQGDIQANNTNGMADGYENTCEDCGEGMDEDDTTYTGIYEDHCVCQRCIDNYTYAYSRRGHQHYIPEDRVVFVDDEWYDMDYLSDNGIVSLACGDYAHQDNAIWVESEDEYYHIDDESICYAADSHQYELTDNCWQCDESGNWYTDDTDYVEVDGNKYHPDHAPEDEAEDEETTEETNPTI